MGGGKESHRGRRSHDDYAREALGPIRCSLLTLFRAIQRHSGKAGLTAFIGEHGSAFGLTPENVYRGRITPIDEVSLHELLIIARENGFIPNAFAELVEDIL